MPTPQSSAITPAVTPAVTIVRTGATSGYLHGFAHRSLIVVLEADPAADLAGAATRLTAALAPHILTFPEQDRPELAGADNSPPHRLARAVWHAAVGLLEAADTPMPRTGRIMPHGAGGDAGPGGRATLALALPAFNAPAVAATVQLVVAIASGMATADAPVALPEDHARRLDQLLGALRSNALKGNNPRHLLRAAIALGIPYVALPLDTLQLGWGKRARLFYSTTTEATPVVGTRIAASKLDATRLLRAAAVPVPANELAPTFDHAVQAAGRLGYPVVVKPSDRECGEGATAGIGDAQDLRIAWDTARALSEKPMVEKHVEGREYRLLVVDGALFWAFERAPAQVTGDGSASVAQLVAVENEGRRAGRATGHARTAITLDAEALAVLARQQLEPASVPNAGQSVRLQGSPRLTGGGDLVPAFDQVHPDNAAIAVRAARLLRLDIAGIDMIIPEIAVSWRENGGRITEVNAGPQFSPYTWPGVYEALLGKLIDRQGRIPAVLLIGDGADATADALHAALCAAGLTPGTATRTGIRIGEDQVAEGLSEGTRAGHVIVTDPAAEAIVLTCDAAELLRQGLPLDRFDAVAIVGPATVGGQPDPQTLRQLGGLLADHMPAGRVFVTDPEAAAALAGAFGEDRIRVEGLASLIAALVAEVLAPAPALVR